MESAMDTLATQCNPRYRLLLLALVVAFPVLAPAQPVPPATRTAFKCKIDGRIVYSDEPCLGAQRIEVEPTRGVDAVSARPPPVSDARREPPREVAPNAGGTVSGSDGRQPEAQNRRTHLSAESQRECRDLDTSIVALEREEREASKAQIGSVQNQLFAARKRFVALGC
jgi:hypothetical protein